MMTDIWYMWYIYIYYVVNIISMYHKQNTWHTECVHTYALRSGVLSPQEYANDVSISKR